MTFKTLIFENFWCPEVVGSSLYQKILAQNLLIFIGLHCVNRLSWSATTLATLINVRRNIESPFFARSCRSANLQKLGAMHSNIGFTLFKDTLLSQFYFPGLFSISSFINNGDNLNMRKIWFFTGNFWKV